MQIFGTSNILNNDMLGKNINYSDLQDLSFTINKCSIPFIRIDAIHCDISDIIKINITHDVYGIGISYIKRDGTTVNISDDIILENIGDTQIIFDNGLYIKLTNDGFQYTEYVENETMGEIEIIPNIKFNDFLSPFNSLSNDDINYVVYHSFVVNITENDITKLEMNSFNSTNYVFNNWFAIEPVTDTFNLISTNNNLTAFNDITFTSNPYVENPSGLYQIFVKTEFKANKNIIYQYGIFANQIYMKFNDDNDKIIYFNSSNYKKQTEYYKLYKATNAYTGGTIAYRTKAQGIDWDLIISPTETPEYRTYRVTFQNEYGIESYNIYNDYKYTIDNTGIQRTINNISNYPTITDINGVVSITGNYIYDNTLNKATHLIIEDSLNNTYSFRFSNFINNICNFTFTIPYVYEYDKTYAFTYYTIQDTDDIKSSENTINHNVINWAPAEKDIIEYVSSSISLGANTQNNYITTYSENDITMFKNDGFCKITFHDEKDIFILTNDIYYMLYGGFKLKSGFTPITNNNISGNGTELINDYINIVVKGKTVARFDLDNNILEFNKLFQAGVFVDSLPTLENYPGIYISDNAFYFICDDLKKHYKSKIMLKIDEYGFIYFGLKYSSII